MGTQSNRQWIIWRDDPKFIDPQTGHLSEPAFRAAVENELAAWENTGHRLGRGLVAAPIREEISEGSYETTGWVFRGIFVPAPKTDREPIQADADENVPDLGEFDVAEERATESEVAA